ncbi:hypothetical protein KGF56_001764 [Candida oxycetoniae]|uniref:Uncharacterized protein n=1 Tax=Candida oxycetoniae TaxID=497107 RepID=A0AAI9SZ21_9ASCO|nr:uncharacterized protein KGF56_001764 [Candida oxycetoniae]KAI3405420.2 hypothetical protein KGF56_001764 [Candida oxycetoniae]
MTVNDDEKSQRDEEDTMVDDFSNDIELFFSSLQNNAKNQAKFDIDEKSAALIQRAARLELESITLKECLEKASTVVKAASKYDMTPITSKVEELSTEVATIKVDKSTIIQRLLPSILEELVKVEKLIEAKPKSDNVEHMFKLLNATISTVDSLSQQNDQLSQTQHHQLKTQNELENRLLSLEKSVQDIKLFLKLLLSRVIDLESVMCCPRETATSSSSSIAAGEGADKGEVKKRKLA